jgi:Right handed beta helix region
MRNRWKLVVPVCLSALLVAALPSFAANVVVGSCMPNKVSYSSLNDAVLGVPAGSTIQVCPGVYTEQVVISKSLILKGITSGNAAYPVIKPPASGLAANAIGLSGSSFWATGTPFAAQILIQGGANVTLTSLALDATGFNIVDCSPVVVGVLVQDASVTLTDVSVKNQLNPCAATGGVGSGVLVQSDIGSATTATVKRSTFTNNGQAYEADGPNVTSTVANSSFLSNPSSAYNAISILNGNSTIQGNSIANFSFPLVTSDINSASFGIYFYCVPGATAAGNTISNTQLGIYAYSSCTTNVTITNNTISDAQLIGIDAGGTNGLVQGNDIRSTQTAIRFPGGSSNTVQNNTINDACAAYGSNPAAGTNTLLGNTVANVINLSLVNSTGLCP